MIEIKNINKTYRSKKGTDCLAINNVSVKFPDKGMVFIMGKSGSGKSTLLNIIGGLDSFDSGEIIIKGVSSSKFDQSYFDSYRNTYVGFIFQEYNLLDDFTVGANVALALELQGKKADNTTINSILDQVDLNGYGNRKPNELSGGQKQRVAIARALVKNPQIILADEPTGALDSTSGNNVLDILKKLSKEKLVIVVSHDREFAEKYGDRIIELADGVIISDVTAKGDDLNKESVLSRITSIFNKYRMSNDDVQQISKYLVINENAVEKKNFVKTEESSIVNNLNDKFKLIKSKLSINTAFRIGVSSFKNKKFRLIVTILLSITAFTMLGVANAAAMYNHQKTFISTIIDSGVKHITFNANYAYEENGKEKRIYGVGIDKETIKQLETENNVILDPMYSNDNYYDFSNYMDIDYNKSWDDIQFIAGYSGVVGVDDDFLNRYGFELVAGKLPTKNNEICISTILFNSFKKFNYCYFDENEFKQVSVKINDYDDMLNRELSNYVVVGVIDTHFNFDRYESILSDEDSISNTLLTYEYSNEMYNLCYNCLFATDEEVDRLTRFYAHYFDYNFDYYSNTNSYPSIASKFVCVDSLNKDDYTLFNGKTSLAENEIIVAKEDIKWIVGGYYDYMYTFEELTNEQIADALKDITYSLTFSSYFADEDDIEIENVKIGGYYDNSTLSDPWFSIVSRSIFEKVCGNVKEGYLRCAVAFNGDRSEAKKLYNLIYGDHEGYEFYGNNFAIDEIDTANSTLKAISKYLLYVSAFFALFAGVLLGNYISTSINYKKKEIGVLRAIGSRKIDVFKIFFSESFVIAMINWILSCVLTFIVIVAINNIMRNDLSILITLIRFSIVQVLLLLFASLLVAVIGSYLPVNKCASKRPIEAIRNN